MGINNKPMKTKKFVPSAVATLLALIFAFGALLGCQKDNEHNRSTSVYALPDAQQETINQNGEYLTGAVHIRGTRDNEIIIALDSKGDKKMADRLFVLQVDEKTQDVKNVSYVLDRAEILFFEHNAVVNTLDKSFSLYFVLDKEESRKIYNALPVSFKTRITKANTYEGYGLANIRAKCDFSLSFLSDGKNLYEALVASASPPKAPND
jgi:hypothetical protein